MQIALPFAGGLLLGAIERNHLEGPEQGPTITDFRRSGHKLRRLRAPFEFDEESIPTISVNTYISRDELFENQLFILNTLESFVDRYRASMSNMRTFCALGYPDEEVTKLLGMPLFNATDVSSLKDLVELIQTVFEAPEWKRHTQAHQGRSTRTLQ
jgi:hypothetical protein